MDDNAPERVAAVIRDELRHWQEIELTEGQWDTVLRALDAMVVPPEVQLERGYP